MSLCSCEGQYCLLVQKTALSRPEKLPGCKEIWLICIIAKQFLKYFLVYLLTETDALKEKNMSSVGGNLPNLFAFCHKTICLSWVFWQVIVCYSVMKITASVFHVFYSWLGE